MGTTPIHMRGGVGEGDRVDGVPIHATRVEKLVNLRTNLDLGARNTVVVDRTRLADLALRMWTPRGLRPGRARLVNAGCTAGHTVEVGVRSGITVGKTDRIRDAAFVEVELIEGITG